MKTKDIREQILKERGLVVQQPTKHRHKRLVKSDIPIPADTTLTTHMRYIEQVYKKPIQQLLMLGSLSVVGKKLNISPSTVSKWKKRLKLVYSPDNLPTCTNCPKYSPTCDVGLCTILCELGLWELALLKKEELLKEEK